MRITVAVTLKIITNNFHCSSLPSLTCSAENVTVKLYIFQTVHILQVIRSIIVIIYTIIIFQTVNYLFLHLKSYLKVIIHVINIFYFY